MPERRRMVELVKRMPLPSAPSDKKNAKQMLRHLHASYDGLIAFLRAHGAMLAALKSDHLLSLEDFLNMVGAWAG